MRKLYIYIAMLCGFIASAQQLPQYSQYMLNQMAINPAVAGSEEFPEVRSNNRLQWLGITDAPRTYMLTLHGPFLKKHMGLGMNLYTDIVGPTRRTGLNFSYAYHLQLEKDMFLSMAVSAGILQWGIDGHKLTLHDDGDQQLLTTYQTAMVPDFGTGVHFYKKNKFYLGFSLPQIHQARIKLYDNAYKNSKIVHQYNLNGAYLFEVHDDVKIEPSFLFKYEVPAPPKLDLGVRAIYKDQVWAGGTFRTGDAFSALVGYMYQNYLMIGYSYDFSIGKIKKYAGGTHELMLGIRFSKRQAPTWETRTAIE